MGGQRLSYGYGSRGEGRRGVGYHGYLFPHEHCVGDGGVVGVDGEALDGPRYLSQPSAVLLKLLSHSSLAGTHGRQPYRGHGYEARRYWDYEAEEHPDEDGYKEAAGCLGEER